MTALVVINLGDYAIFVADKMVSSIKDRVIVHQTEDAIKIVETPLGLITGSGAVDLLDPVKEYVKSGYAKETDDILNFIIKERERYFGNKKLSIKQAKEDIDTTGWIMSYIKPSYLRNELKVIAYHPSENDQYFMQIEKNKSRIFFPSDLSQEFNKDLRDYFINMMEVDLDLSSFENDEHLLSYYSEKALLVIKEMSLISQFVSEKCDVGFMHFDNSKGIRYSVKKGDFLK